MKQLVAILNVVWAFVVSAASQPMPDFELVDANTYSVRNGRQVSPRNYWLQVSVYYFGASN